MATDDDDDDDDGDDAGDDEGDDDDVADDDADDDGGDDDVVLYRGKQPKKSFNLLAIWNITHEAISCPACDGRQHKKGVLGSSKRLTTKSGK